MNQKTETACMALSETEMAMLRSAAGYIIPANAAMSVPGADDPAIFADIVASIGRYGADIHEALRRIEAAAGGVLATMSDAERGDAMTRFRREQPALAVSLGAVVARCYYRDDRVMRAIGMEVRAPYPQGFELEQGDWSLLDPVRKRGRMYRDAG